MKQVANRRGFTMLELLALLVLIIAAGLLLPALAKARQSARSLKNNTQVKNVLLALITDANKSRDEIYPTPSVMDANNRTIAIPGAAGKVGDAGVAKDNTGNVMSYLTYINALIPEVCVSPSEPSGSVAIDFAYQWTRPARASVPAEALWDPGFAGTPLDDGPGAGKGRRAKGVSNNSYAMTTFANVPDNAKRAATWKANNSSSQVVVSGRGPSYAQESTPATGVWTLVPRGELGGQFKGPGVDSLAVRSPEGRGNYFGPMGYNDGSVNSETVPNPRQISMLSTIEINRSSVVADNVFVNELNDKSRAKDAAKDDWRAGTNMLLLPVAMVAPGEGKGVPSLTAWKD